MLVDQPDIPDRRGGWWHEYVCPAHGSRLLAARDGRFPCPHGCALTGEPYAGAWAALAHQAAARALRRLAVSARGGAGGPAVRTAAADAAVVGLGRYAELYRRLATDSHTEARPWMLAGRLFQQALTEAIWGTSIALAAQTLVGVIPAERLRPVAELLRALRSGAREARDTLLARDDFENNYTAWLNAAGATTSRALALLGEPDETDAWVRGRHGVAEHLAAAVHPDGWEWEGSAYYHVFVLRAYLLALRGRVDLLSEELAARLVGMLDVVAALGLDRGGVVPALHDTPYRDPGWDEELYELCLLAAALPAGREPVPDLGFLAVPLAERLPAAMVGWRREEARDWYAAGGSPPRPAAPRRGSRLFPDAGYAVLAGEGYRAVLDLGPHGGSHGHLDKLALYLYGRSTAWQPAYGVPPYAHPWRRDYYRATAAHPTLTVDDTDQAEVGGRLLYWCTGDGRAEVGAAASVYPGVRFERHVRAEPGWLLDVVRVVADRERLLTLHLRADVEVTVRHPGVVTRTRWPGEGEGEGDLTGLHTAVHSGPGRAVLTTGADLGPADDPQRGRPHLRWQVRATAAVFGSVYSLAGSGVTGLRVERSGAELTVHVERADREPVRWSITPREDDR